MLESRQFPPARMKREIAAATVGERARYRIEIGPTRGALVGDRVQPRQR